MTIRSRSTVTMHKIPPEATSPAIRISDTNELIVSHATHVIMRMTATVRVHLPILILAKLEKFLNGGKTLVAVKDRRIELHPRNGTIGLSAKFGSVVQLLIIPTERRFDLDAELDLGADTIVRSDGNVKGRRIPRIVIAAISVIMAPTAAMPLCKGVGSLISVASAGPHDAHDLATILAKCVAPLEAVQTDRVGYRKLRAGFAIVAMLTQDQIRHQSWHGRTLQPSEIVVLYL